jgi:hypothetical protein
MTPSIVKGYRALPVVKDNPQWWMIEIFDGFGAQSPRCRPFCQRTRPEAEGYNLVNTSGYEDINCGSVGTTTYQEQAYEPY